MRDAATVRARNFDDAGPCPELFARWKEKQRGAMWPPGAGYRPPAAT